MSRLDDRWEAGKDHHPTARKFKSFLYDSGIAAEVDWKFGGDGDDGEAILMALSEFLEHEERQGGAK